MLLLFVIHWNKQFTHVISVQKWLVPVVSSHPLLNLSPCASSRLKRCRDSLCPSFTHNCGYCLFFFFPFLSIFTCNLYCIIQNLGVPSTHTHTKSPAWLANDLQLTNGVHNMNGSMASMQMYAKQIRYGRKQTSLCFSPSQFPGTVVLRRTPCADWCWITSGRGWRAGRLEQLGLSITSPTMWQTWTRFLSCTAACQRPRCSRWKKLLHSLESVLFGGALEGRRGGTVWLHE